MAHREAIDVAVVDGVATVQLIGPGKGNAMGPAFWREVPEVFGELDADDSVRAVVLHGRGAHFSYGLDLMAMLPEIGPQLQGGGMAASRLELLAFIERLQDAFNALERCRKPVIAAVAGWCVGGGLDMIAACDVRLCSADARFSVREVKLAMVADVGSLQRLPRIIGQGHTRELAFTGKDIDADRALRIGLVNDVYPDREALLDAAAALAAEIAANSPLAVQGAKRVLNWSMDHPSSSDGLAYVAAWNAAFLQSQDLFDAITAFASRRSSK